MKKLVLILNLLLGSLAFADAKLKIWSPKERLEISNDKIVIDGKEEDFKCGHDEKTVVGKINFKGETFKISCSDDYPTGISIEDQTFADHDGDTGETWETQSLLFYDNASKSIVWSTITYTTNDPSIECELDGKKDCPKRKVECKKTGTLKRWNAKQKSFSAAKFEGKIPSRNLKPHEIYQDDCK